VEQNRKAGQNPPRAVAPTEEEEDYLTYGTIFGKRVSEPTAYILILYIYIYIFFF